MASYLFFKVQYKCHPIPNVFPGIPTFPFSKLEVLFPYSMSLYPLLQGWSDFSVMWLCLYLHSHIYHSFIEHVMCHASLVAQMVKCLPARQETRVRSLGWEDPWRRKWQPPPVLLPGKFHGLRSLVGYSPWGRKESDTTEWLHRFKGSRREKTCTQRIIWYWWKKSKITQTNGKIHDVLGLE